MPSLPVDWLTALDPPWNDPVRVDQLMTRARRGFGSGPVFPASPDEVFQAFELTPYSGVRAVLVGQDPYPDVNLARGVAFSAPGAPLPKSLEAIFANLEASNLASAFSRPSPEDGDLNKWAARGILLINAALTFEGNQLGSHCRHWKPFLRAVLVAVCKKPEHVPVILLGGRAVDLKSSVMPIEARVCSGHPTPRNKRAKRFPLFALDQPFVRANAFLTNHLADPIDWSLT